MEQVSGFYEVPVTSVIIPEFRQRQAAVPDEALLTSIRDRGLLQPIILHADMTLVCGERRLRAHMELAKPTILARIFEKLSPVERFEAELQENLARKQLTWQEEVKAIGAYHGLRHALNSKNGGSWTQLGTATALGITPGHISKILAVFASIENEDVLSCPTFTGAFNLICARAERATIAAQSRGLIVASAASLMPNLPVNATKEERTSALINSLNTENVAAKTVEDLDKNLRAISDGRIATAALEAARRLEVVSDLIINADFLEWAEAYDGPKFDVLHIDFPYGKNYSGARTRRTGKAHIAPMYADDPDVYKSLVEGFLVLQDRVAFPAAHCLFWFDMSYYAWTVEMFSHAGWTLVQPYPFIWTKGYQGIASDVKRRPRHCYETALLFSRGDRKIVKLDKDHFDCAIDEKLHMNQKPLAMLKHLLSMFVDEHTAVLDPTCGSGSAIAAAKQLHAARVLGIELDSDNAEVAKFLLQRETPVNEPSQ